MHDIRFIREHPDQFDAAMKRRKVDMSASSILEIDSARRALQSELQDMQSRRNIASKEIGKLKANGGDADALIAEVNDIKTALPDIETREADLAHKLDSVLMEIPNILDVSVPDGDDEHDNELIHSYGDIPSFSFTPIDHVALGEGLGQMDFALGAKLAGARFVVLQGQLARLERALAALMLDTHTSEFGYIETVPPSLVNSQTMTGTGQLPKFAEDLYKTDDKWLIPTAEVPLTNIVAGDILTPDILPIRMTAYTNCFRSEAGSAGRDTRGMIRQHQFSKVEMVSISHPDDSAAELERMTGCAEAILQKLELPYRVLKLCSGDTGFSAEQTYDLEVWLPGQDEGRGMYREISSCSNCGPFQARRMKARYRDKDTGETQFLHTLNGSGLAVGRTMIAILENGQQEDGTVCLPAALHPYMGTDRLIKQSA
ncbi:serine--tRNA ligase [Candidatus Puniceispirillum marinum]|uniref:Serine--tRNA ligase n=1 Tax=Puniceispirillum marinum (strain IMCC1322) TaxID=488538 RepID=D5BQU1_PUNMI|nr:serine--tRNA ligase [Candidatus Puniceispirillum marinum]ADE38655.1 Serine--tRNA ligase [Candidatus Puniceispirillum marinum IMCC1322]